MNTFMKYVSPKNKRDNNNQTLITMNHHESLDDEVNPAQALVYKLFPLPHNPENKDDE
jgi:hypothetical protein